LGGYLPYEKKGGDAVGRNIIINLLVLDEEGGGRRPPSLLLGLRKGGEETTIFISPSKRGEKTQPRASGEGGGDNKFKIPLVEGRNLP